MSAIERLVQVSLGNKGTPDGDGRLLFIDERLVAVLCCLSAMHEELEGRWFIEHGFDLHETTNTFATLEEASAWVAANRKSA